jgi:hypothetical protein
MTNQLNKHSRHTVVMRGVGVSLLMDLFGRGRWGPRDGAGELGCWNPGKTILHGGLDLEPCCSHVSSLLLHSSTSRFRS